jgi:hypothetical protein
LDEFGELELWREAPAATESTEDDHFIQSRVYRAVELPELEVLHPSELLAEERYSYSIN